MTGGDSRGPGRPRKTAPPPPNIGDHDLATQQRFRDAAARVIANSPHCRTRADEQREQLAAALADELVYLSPTIGLSTTLRKGQRGPKAKLAQVVLIAQVGIILQRFGIAPKEWAAGNRRETELTDWCRELLKAAGLPGQHFSDRQSRAAKLTKAQQAISAKLDLPGE